jgi:predicted O-methyltransferase YrrM
VPPQEALLLFRLIRAFKPSVCLEMGTSLGISAAYQAAALELNGYGRIVTLEGEESLVRLARQNFERLGLDRVTVVPGRFQDTLADVAREQAPLDFAFIDGHHDEHATVAYYRQILPHVGPSAVLVFDDISWSPGMGRAWKTIAQDERVGLAVDVSGVGICVVSDSLANQPTLRIPIL